MESAFEEFCSPTHEMRELRKSDYEKFYFETLSNLTEAPKISKADFETEFDIQQSSVMVRYVHLVIEDRAASKIAAAGSLLIETHITGDIGHIESIVVAKDGQGAGWGSKIMRALNKLAMNHFNCTECSLYCKQQNAGFYEKMGYVLQADECFLRK